MESARSLAGNLAIIGAPAHAELIGEHAFDLGSERMLLVVGRLGVVSRIAVVAWLASALVGLIKSIYGDLRYARLFAQVSLDCFVHADQELVALVAHPRDKDMQAIGFELPIAHRRLTLVVDRLDDYFQRPVIPMVRLGTCRRRYERQRGGRKDCLFWLHFRSLPHLGHWRQLIRHLVSFRIRLFCLWRR